MPRRPSSNESCATGKCHENERNNAKVHNSYSSTTTVVASSDFLLDTMTFTQPAKFDSFFFYDGGQGRDVRVLAENVVKKESMLTRPCVKCAEPDNSHRRIELFLFCFYISVNVYVFHCVDCEMTRV